MMRRMWQVSSRPRRFFSALEENPPRLLVSLGVALLAYLTGALALGVAFLRLTASDAVLPVMLAAAIAGSLHLLFLWCIGGFLLQIPAELEGRAWEVAGWSWSPLLFLGFAALPLAFFSPFLGVVFLLGGTLVWHSLVVNAALQALVPGKVNRTFATYFLVLFGVPMLTVTLGIYAVGAL